MGCLLEGAKKPLLNCTDDDVVGAVRLARQSGMKIAIRSGGHSWVQRARAFSQKRPYGNAPRWYSNSSD